MTKPVCLVTGVGPEHGTGADIAKRFNEGGYEVAMLARNAEKNSRRSPPSTRARTPTPAMPAISTR